MEDGTMEDESTRVPDIENGAEDCVEDYMSDLINNFEHNIESYSSEIEVESENVQKPISLGNEHGVKRQSPFKTEEGESDGCITAERQFFETSNRLRPVYVNIDWPPIEQFELSLGFKKIDEFIGMWKLKYCWKHCIDFLALVKAISSDYYFYEVKWSIPYKSYPIPVVTASVYFRIEVSHIKPPDHPVEVSYTFETSRYAHVPGKINFQEKWLEEILLYKLILLPTVRF